MAASLGSHVLDNGISRLDADSTHIVVCDAEPTAYSLASVGAANTLGYKSFGAGGAFGSPGAGAPNGRKVDSNAITDGTITTGGTAKWWAAIDSGNSRLDAHGSLSSSQVVASGNTFSLASFTIRIPDQ